MLYRPSTVNIRSSLRGTRCLATSQSSHGPPSNAEPSRTKNTRANGLLSRTSFRFLTVAQANQSILGLSSRQPQQPVENGSARLQRAAVPQETLQVRRSGPPHTLVVKRQSSMKRTSAGAMDATMSVQSTDAKTPTPRPERTFTRDEVANQVVVQTSGSTGGSHLDFLKAGFASPPRLVRRRAGDYTGHLPVPVAVVSAHLQPMENARLALGRNKQVPFKKKQEVLGIIERSICGEFVCLCPPSPFIRPRSPDMTCDTSYRPSRSLHSPSPNKHKITCDAPRRHYS